MAHTRAPSAESSNLDLIRAVAVLCVFVAHLIDRARGSQSDITWHVGQMGVLIFFVHTALVLMRSLDRSPLTGAALFRDFYIRRAFRIYPLAIVCVAIGAVIGGWPVPATLSHLALTMNLTYTEPRCCALWSLPLEVQMYLFLPFVFLALRAAAAGRVALLWTMAVAIALIQPSVSGRLTVFAWAPCFVGGIVAWWLAARTQRRFPAWIWPLVFVATWAIWLTATREHHWLYRWAFTLILGLAIPWFRDLSWRGISVPAKLVARYSYGIYLSHLAIHDLALSLASPLRWIVLIALAVAVPVVLYHAIEAPMIRAGRAVLTRRPQRTPIAEPFPA